MRVLDIIQLNEFDQGDFVMPEIDIIGPNDPETAAINKQNALLLLQLDPDAKAMSEVHKLLAQYQKSSGNDELQPVAQEPQAQPSAVTEPVAQVQPSAVTEPVAPAPAPAPQQVQPGQVPQEPEDDEDETDEFGNPISEGKKA